MPDKRPKMMFFHAGFSPYDEFFVQSLSDLFQVSYFTLNPHPTVKFRGTTPSIIPHPFAFLYGHKVTTLLLQATSVQYFRRLVRRFKPDVIVGCYATTYGFLCAKSGFSPNVLFVYGSDVVIDSRNPFLYPIVRTALAHADLVLLDSIVQENATVRLGVPKSKIIRLPWIDAEAIAKTPRLCMSFRRRLGWEDKKIILCTRSHERMYCVDKVILAFAQVQGRFPKTGLILAGTGSQTHSLSVLASRLGVESNIAFLGWIPRRDIISLCDECDVYVSASLSDGTSASLIEAMARRLLVVASDIAGNREWIEDGRNGFIVDSNLPGELAATLMRALYLDRQEKERVTGAALETVMQRANWLRNRRLLLDATSKLVKGGQNQVQTA